VITKSIYTTTTRIAYGCGDQDVNPDDLYSHIRRITSGMNKRRLIPPFMWEWVLNDNAEFKESIQFIHSIIDNSLKIHAGSKSDVKIEDVDADIKTSGDNYISQMLSSGLNDDDIKQEASTFFLALSDSTSGVILSSLMYLLTNEHVKTKLMEEISSVENVWDVNTLTNLVYLHCVINEALRLSPSASLIPREADKDFQLGEHMIPKGTGILVNVEYIHRDPLTYPDPDKFMPERFLEYKTRTHIPNFFGFGYSARRCPGMKIGHMITKLFLVHLLTNYEMSVVPNQNIERIAIVSTLVNELKISCRKK